jgi:hypothetical protein
MRTKPAVRKSPRGKSTIDKPSPAKSSREKVQAHRARMRRRGMKLVQIWVPDPSSPHFAEEARRQARLLAKSPLEKEDQAFVDAMSEWKP